MRKEELIKALLKRAKAEGRNGKAEGRNGKAEGRNGKAEGRNGKAEGRKVAPAAARVKAPTSSQAKSARRKAQVEQRLQEIRERLAESKDLALRAEQQENGQSKDRLVVMVRDPYWLHAYWELSRRGVQRAQAALGHDWHIARPVLRIFEVVRDGTTNAGKRLVRDIEVHGGVNNWYVDVQNPPRSFQLEIGYRAGERFLSLARSNRVSTPQPGAGDSFDRNWAEVAKDFDRIFAMSGGYADPDASMELKEVFEEQLHRPMGNPMETRFGSGAIASPDDVRAQFPFEIDTELIVHGQTAPNSHVTLRGEPVHLRSDGSFAIRFSLPDRRHVLPVVASSPDGGQQRTIVLAVDRNTKIMEPVNREPGE
ncbi:MAG: DUF4912 domain-containing protein [Patescibacteria group bacterium]|nr:DUF4912 domain-containing protein [Patescibacteria group bacterium]